MLEMDSFLLVLITTEHLFQMKKKQFVKNLESLILYFSSNDCHQIVHSTEYKSTLRRNNAIVKYKDDFDEAKTFVKVNVLALNHPMEKSTVTIPNCHYLQAATPYHGGLHQIEHFSSTSERHL